MPQQPPTVRISSANDIIATVPLMLGFAPTNSLVVICAHGPRCRLGLAMRFALDFAAQGAPFIADVAARVRHEHADAYIVVVYADVDRVDDARLPYTDLIDGINDELFDINRSGYLVVGDAYWSYCPEPDCCPPGPTRLTDDSPGAIAMAAAYALNGTGVLPSRDAVVESLAYRADDDQWERMITLLTEADIRRQSERRADRRSAVRALISRLCSAVSDPRYVIADADIADLASLCQDVIVRDEVLVRALKPRRRAALQRVLTAVVQRLPPPYDAPLCSVLAWVAYLGGDGAIANVALDRAFASDPDYSLAHLIADSLDRQVAPFMLEEVMRGAARDLKHGREAG